MLVEVLLSPRATSATAGLRATSATAYCQEDARSGPEAFTGPSLPPKEFGAFEKGLPSGELQKPSCSSADLVNAGAATDGYGY